MAKYRNPFNTKELWISQTYHSTSSNKAVDFGNSPARTPVYAVADGTIGTISSAYGSYLTQDVANSDHKLFYVHIYNFKVSKGQSVKKGQLLAEVAPQSVNGGFSPHLHLGLQTQYNLMDYMDRSIVFRTKYQAIKNIWFTGENLDWSKHKDLSYLSNAMLKIGDRVELTADTNLRVGSGVSFNIKTVVKKGAVGEIIGGPRTADGYEWWDIRFLGGNQGWMANPSGTRLVRTTKNITQTDRTVVKPPEPPAPPGQTECEKQVESLKEEILALESITELLEGEKEVLITQNVELHSELSRAEAEVLEYKEALKESLAQYDALHVNYNRLENEKNDLVLKLQECGEGQGTSLKLFILELLQKLGLVKK